MSRTYCTEQLETGLPKIPQHMREGITEYVLRGRPAGNFLMALLCNEPFSTIWRSADDINQMAIGNWMSFLYNNAPSVCHGSREAVAAWVAQGGVTGKVDNDDEEA